MVLALLPYPCVVSESCGSAWQCSGINPSQISSIVEAYTWQQVDEFATDCRGSKWKVVWHPPGCYGRLLSQQLNKH